jgi:cyanophycin synthetase
VTSSLLELRVLEGPNLYFSQAATKLTLDVTALTEVSVDVASRLAKRIGLSNVRPGEAGSGFRQRFAARTLARLVRQVAAEAGTHRLAVRVRPTSDPDRLVVAYPWRHRGRAEALGQAVADVLDGLADADIDEIVSGVARTVRNADPGPRPTTIKPRIPIVAVTGTNGKTTTSRMIGHIAQVAGLHVGWSSTDGIYADGVLVESGDYSGPSGAGRVLAQSGVQLAVTETARGGILLRGIGVTHNDVSVVTNVSADHLGMQGIDTVDQLAEVKAVVPRITKANGWAVLNGDDPRVIAMRSVTTATPWVFSRDPDSPSIREVLGAGGRATTVIDGWICVLASGADADPVVRLVDVPMTLSGLSHVNVENALAAASAALGVGLPKEAVVQGLESFEPGPEHSPGRMNIYSLGAITVVVDLAHNESGLDALLEIMRGLCALGARTLLAVGTAGDRSDELLRNLGAIGARGSDVMVIVHKLRYLRGRGEDEITALYRAGAAEVGVEEVPAYESELAGLAALVERARKRDVVGVMCHQDRVEVDRWLRDHGGSVDSPDVLRDKVILAGGDADLGRRGHGHADGVAAGWRGGPGRCR